MTTLAPWHICSALCLQYLMIHIYVVSVVRQKHPISDTGLFSSKYPCNLMATLEISHNMKTHEDIKHVKVMVLIIFKIQSTNSPQLFFFIYNFFPHPYLFSEFRNNSLHTMSINNKYPWSFFIPDNRQ